MTCGPRRLSAPPAVPFLNRISVGIPRMPKLRRRLRVLVDVDLGDLEPVLVFLGDLVEHRCDHLARPTPLGPEVEQHGSGGFQNVLVERGVCGVNDLLAHSELPPEGLNDEMKMCELVDVDVENGERRAPRGVCAASGGRGGSRFTVTITLRWVSNSSEPGGGASSEVRTEPLRLGGIGPNFEAICKPRSHYLEALVSLR